MGLAVRMICTVGLQMSLATASVCHLLVSMSHLCMLEHVIAPSSLPHHLTSSFCPLAPGFTFCPRPDLTHPSLAPHFNYTHFRTVKPLRPKPLCVLPRKPASRHRPPCAWPLTSQALVWTLWALVQKVPYYM